MSRTARAARADICYHVFSRGNARQTLFHDADDYQTFTTLLRSAHALRPTRLLAWCVMPNHFHLVLCPFADGDLGSWMQWLLTSHVHRHRRRYTTIGRIWQGRFKAFPIQQDEHLLTVLRYVERNPVRAGLVGDSTEWRWSSAVERQRETGEPLQTNELLAPSPVELPTPWIEWVNRPLNAAVLASIQECTSRERPFGERAWVHGTVDRLGLRSTLRRRGRPASTVR